MKTFRIGKNIDVRWFNNAMWYHYFDRYNWIIELGRLSIVWIRKRST